MNSKSDGWNPLGFTERLVRVGQELVAKVSMQYYLKFKPQIATLF